MARRDIFERQTQRDLEVGSQRDEDRQKQSGASVSVGRGPTDNSTPKQYEKPERPNLDAAGRSRHREAPSAERSRTYPLRDREIRALTDIGTFRTIDAQDLARFAYSGNAAAMNYDLGELRTNGLVQDKLLQRAHGTPRRVLALTAKGHRILRRASGLSRDQKLYHDFVKPREIEHDADLYKVYQKAAEEVHVRGGRLVRVRLDFELKSAIQRERNVVRVLSENEREKHLRAFAESHSLTMTGGRIQVPDVQIEYETRDGELERTNLELVSENYRTEGIRGKAGSGFAIYARGRDTSRIRRALQDTHTVERILSI